jgi:toxin ParE1/3/4
MKVIFSDEADRDLLQIHAYLAERNPDAAIALANEFKRKIENLSRFPFIGRERNNIAKDLRSIVAETYVIFYIVERAHLTIVRVLDGRRDIDTEFQR